jgi:Ca2+-binding RTX toxin-like protein
LADGDDTINMGAGNDQIYTGPGNQDIHGGPGMDSVLYGYYYYYYDASTDLTISLNDVADDGNPAAGETDNIHTDVEALWTGNGDDTITGSAAANTITSGDGNDVVNGAGGRDRLHGGSGNDILSGGADNDRINDGAGNDIAKGGGGDDYLDGSDPYGDDSYNGGAGVDFLAIYRDNDVSVTLDDMPNDGETGEADNVMSNIEDVFTGAGNDRIIGSMASNTLSGGAGNDIIRGRDGNDELDGDLGRDTLFSGRGTDTIAGGGNVDTITSQDRYADYVTCGGSIDSLNHDRHDQVAVDCETLS